MTRPYLVTATQRKPVELVVHLSEFTRTALTQLQLKRAMQTHEDVTPDALIAEAIELLYAQEKAGKAAR